MRRETLQVRRVREPLVAWRVTTVLECRLAVVCWPGRMRTYSPWYAWERPLKIPRKAAESAAWIGALIRLDDRAADERMDFVRELTPVMWVPMEVTP